MNIHTNFFLNLATEVVDFGFIEVDGGAQTEDEEERGEEAANSLPNKSERKGSITFEVKNFINYFWYQSYQTFFFDNK